MKRTLTLERFESRRMLASFTPTLVKDITPGDGSTEFEEFFPAENHLYFTANGGELWRTDGSPDETAFLGNVDPTVGYYSTPQFIELPNGITLFYAFDDGIRQLWRTDGTSQGTRLWLSDRWVSQPAIATNENWVLLPISHGENTEFWRVDAESEPVLLRTVSNQPGPFHFEIHDGVVYFNRDMSGFRPPESTELFRTDGTLENTKVLFPTLSSNPVRFNPVQSDTGLLFVTSQESKGVVFEITNAGQEPTTFLELPWTVIDFRAYGDRFGFFAESLSENETPQWQLGFSDGTSEGTSLMDVSPIIHRPSWIGEFGGALLFKGTVTAKKGVTTWGVLRTNGTAAGTYSLVAADYVGQIDGRAYLGTSLGFGTGVHYFTDGAEIFDAWLPRTVDPAPVVSRVGDESVLPPPADRLLFDSTGLTITSRSSSNGLGVSSVRRYEPDDTGVLVQQGPTRVEGTHTAQVEGDWYTVRSGSLDRLYTTLIETTRRIERIYQDSLEFVHSDPGEKLYFAFGPKHQERLWVIGENQFLEDIGPFSAASGHQTGSDVFYSATTPSSGLELWATNGTPSGTEEIDLWPGPASSAPEMVPWNGATLVVANTPGKGRELWRIDGSLPEPSESIAAGLRSVDLQDEVDLDIPIELIHSQNVTDVSWDLNNDGKFGDAKDANPKLDWQQLNSLQPRIARNSFQPYSVRFTDESGANHVKTSLLRIQNPAPSIADIIGLPSEIHTMQNFDVEVLASDQNEILYSIDFGDGTIVEQPQAVFSHHFSRMGRYTVKVTVGDEHGARSLQSREITVFPADASKAWLFQPGTVFGGNEATTDIALGGADYQGLPNLIITSASDGPSERFRIQGHGKSLPASQDDFPRVQNSNGFAVANLGDFYGIANVVFATATGVVANQQPWQFGLANVDSHDLVFADLNGDDFQDIFVANYQDANGVPAPDLVLLNKQTERSTLDVSTGSDFELHASLPPGRSHRVEVGDLNGDGTLDVVTSGPDSNHIWFNDGLANFTESRQSLAPAANHIAIDDLNGDGFNDLVAATDGANLVWINDGTGFFALSPQAIGNAASNHVAVGDMDGDRDVDLVFANGLGDATTVWINDGTGRFSDSGARLAEDVSTTRIALGDIDRDGSLDVIAAHSGVPNQIYLTQHNKQPFVIILAPAVRSGQLQEITAVFDVPATLEYLTLNARGRPTILIGNDDVIWTADRKRFTVDLSNYEIGEGRHELGIRAYGDTQNVDTLTTSHQTFRIYKAGDINQDGKVDSLDAGLLIAVFGSPAKIEDIDGDGLVGFADFLLLSRDYGKS